MKHKINGEISLENPAVAAFVDKMSKVDPDEPIILEINSYGGDTFLGIDICNTLSAHQGYTTAVVTGIAASAGSIICMGADKIKAFSNTQMMLHNAWTVAIGESKDLKKTASFLDLVGESVIDTYAKRLEDKEMVKKMLDEETYLTAEQAKEYGFVDEVITNAQQAVQSEQKAEAKAETPSPQAQNKTLANLFAKL
ncbi:head maturation protease, ClpP-related [Bacillus sp. FSL W7-1360]